jgi:ABC-2 type transport system ATP-binding protein
MSKPLAIDVHGLTKRFGKLTAVNGIDIQVPEGEVWGFVGPNGSGKTTTIRMLCGLLKPDAGDGQCLGADIRRETETIKRQVGYMTQRFSFWEDMTVRENLEFTARIYEMPDIEGTVRQTLEDFQLTQRQNQLAQQLSGGWKQRLALAACMLHKPRLLLLDEPTAGVDPQARRDFWEEIHRLSLKGLTVLVSTHYMDEAERCDRIVYILHGSIVARGTVPEVVAQAGLITYVVKGSDVRRFLEPLSEADGVQHVSFFGALLHVSGRDRAKLERALAPLRGQKGISVEETPTSLEDAFIDLQSEKSPDGKAA